MWLERAPLWIIGLALLAGLIAAEQLGYALRRLMAKPEGSAESSEGLGYLITGTLALLALLIAFTFGEASNRFDARRFLVIGEANAFVTTYLRFQALDDAPRAALSRLMVQYVHAREDSFEASDETARLEKAAARTAGLQKEIWANVTAAVRSNPTATINPSLLQTTNDMFDLASSRRAALDARLPIAILSTLVIYALISAAVIGYALAGGPRQLVASAALFLTLTLAISLILDLDRPRAGQVTISQVPIARAIASLESMEAAKVRTGPIKAN